MTDSELLEAVERLRDLLMSSGTGGARIDDANVEYRRLFAAVSRELASRSVPNPIPFDDLWAWHGRYRSGDLPTYQARRTYLLGLFSPFLARLRTGHAEPQEPTGWPRVDRTVDSLLDQLSKASSEAEFQTVGLLGREALISLAQAVFDPTRHPTLDGTVPSATDAKRMLEAYIAVELKGSVHEELRAHVRSALALGIALQHRRPAAFRDAAICTEATTAVINIVAILAGKRDPAS